MKWRAIPAALVIVLAAAACGDDDGGDDEGGGLGGLVTTTTAEEVEETTTTEDDAEATTTTTEADDDLPAGWTLYEPGDFTIGLPEGWIDGEELVADPAFAAEVESILGGPEQVEALYSQLDLIAFDRTTFGTFGTNVNVIVNPRVPADTIENLEAQVPSQLQTAFAGEVTESTRTEIGGEEALRIVYEYTLQERPLVGVQYYVLGEDQAGVITFTTTADGTPLDDFTPIAESFRLVS